MLGTFWVDLRGGLGSASREGVTRFRLLLVCCINSIFCHSLSLRETFGPFADVHDVRGCLPANGIDLAMNPTSDPLFAPCCDYLSVRRDLMLAVTINLRFSVPGFTAP